MTNLKHLFRLACCLAVAPVSADSDRIDLTFPASGQSAPIISSDHNEYNTGEELSADAALERDQQNKQRHLIILKDFRQHWVDPSQAAEATGQGAVTEPAKQPTPEKAKPNDKQSKNYGAFLSPQLGTDKGLLWRVKRSDPGRISFLFGTIHVEDARLTNLPEAVQLAFQKSRSLTVEAKVTNPDLSGINSAMIYTDGSTLEKVVGASLFNRASALLEQQGVPRRLVNTLKPWAVAMFLMTPKQSSGMFLDRKLQLDAQRANKPIHALETIAEQLAVFQGLDASSQISLLKDAVEKHNLLPQVVEELMQAYLARDLGELQRLSKRFQPSDPNLAYTVRTRMVEQRNKTMVQRLLPRLKEGGTFIAVGALHLPGENGMLALLAKEGFSVSAIY